MASYKLGTGDPTITPDAGAGKWASKSWTVEMVAYKAAIFEILPHAYVIIGADAAMHMMHYLDNSGTTYTVRLAQMISDVPSAKALYELELASAKAFVETLSPGTHEITSQKASGGYNTKAESWNWFFAVGGYSAWGKGVAEVAVDKAGKRGYRLDFEYRFYDRYNWDKGKSVTIFHVKITDEFMGEFHREGLAQEFDVTGSYKTSVTWGTPSAIPPAKTGAGGR